MRDIPRPIVRAYQAALDGDNVPVDQRPHYVRWLRYYLDFCHKYNHDPELDASALPFEDKLIEKRQEDWKRQQAYQGWLCITGCATAIPRRRERAFRVAQPRVDVHHRTAKVSLGLRMLPTA